MYVGINDTAIIVAITAVAIFVAIIIIIIVVIVAKLNLKKAHWVQGHPQWAPNVNSTQEHHPASENIDTQSDNSNIVIDPAYANTAIHA